MYKMTKCTSRVKNNTFLKTFCERCFFYLGKILYKRAKIRENKFNYLTNNLLKICILVNVFKNLY